MESSLKRAEKSRKEEGKKSVEPEKKTQFSGQKELILQEDIASSKFSFRIDFYDEGEGPVRGKIEHLLTKKRKAFQGLDAESHPLFHLNPSPPVDFRT